MNLLNCLILAFLLFGIGVWGLMRRRHLIGMLISIELCDCRRSVQYLCHCRDGLRNGHRPCDYRDHVPPPQES